jgi:hypothetical protein
VRQAGFRELGELNENQTDLFTPGIRYALIPVLPSTLIYISMLHDLYVSLSSARIVGPPRDHLGW